MINLTVNGLRKEGKYKLAYQKAINNLLDKPGYIPYIDELVWVYYDFSKIAVANSNVTNMLKISSKLCELHYLENNIFNESFNWLLVKLLNNKNLQASKSQELINLIKSCSALIKDQEPSLSKSVLLKSFIRLIKKREDAWQLYDYLCDKHYRKEDFQSEYFDNKKMMPLYELALYTSTKSWLKAAEQGYRDALENQKLVLEVLTKYEARKDYRFVKYYISKVYNIINNKDKAQEYAKAFLKTAITQSYAWALISENCTNRAKNIIYLSKAIVLQRDEQYSIGLRQKLMSYLNDNEDKKLIEYLAVSIIKTRRSNNWTIPNSLDKWRDSKLERTDINNAIQKLNIIANKAIGICFNDVETVVSIIVSERNNKYIAKDSKGRQYHFKYKKGLKSGSFVNIKYDGIVLEVLWTEAPKEIKGAIRYYEGNYKSIKDFGFIHNIFISPYISNKMQANKLYKGYAIEELNKKTKKIGWKAICAEEIM